MKDTAFILVLEEDAYNSMFKVLFADILKKDNVFLVTETSFPHMGIYLRLQKLPFSLPKMWFEHSLRKKYQLPRRVDELRKEYRQIKILFHNVSLRKAQYPESIFRYLRKKGVSLNMLYMDKYDHFYVTEYTNRMVGKGMFDKVFSFDPEDACKHGFELCFTPYSRLYPAPDPPAIDLYCCVSSHDRAYVLYSIFTAIKDTDVRFRFDTLYYDKLRDFFSGDPRVKINTSFTPYPDILSETLKANCILDLTFADQTGLTLRPYEAVVYNRKLLTNNKAIFSFKYYDPRYMRYFSTADEIDWDWVKKREPVDYGYAGEFSPKYLLEKTV